MASIEIRFVASPGTNRTYTVGNDVVGGVMKMEALGSGGGPGAGGGTNGGGGGKGGAYARRNAQTVASGDVLTINIGAVHSTLAGSAGNVSTVIRAGVTLLSARAGVAGGAGSVTAGGTGATTQTGTFTGDVEFLGGNGGNGGLVAAGAGGGGAGTAANGGNATTTNPGAATPKFGGSGGANGGAASTNFGAAGSGIVTGGTPQAGSQGIVVLTYSTGVGTITHTPIFSRRITAKRSNITSIVHTAVFSRKITIRRMFQSAINHIAFELKKIKLPRASSIIHTARQTTKRVRLSRVASIIHTAFLRRYIRFSRVSSIVHTPVFKRLVTLRRRFTASIIHRTKMFMKLEGRLIPSSGGGGTVINYIRSLIVFDD